MRYEENNNQKNKRTKKPKTLTTFIFQELLKKGSSPEIISTIRSFRTVFLNYFRELLGNDSILRHCIRDLTDSRPVSVFLKDSFFLSCHPKVLFVMFFIFEITHTIRSSKKQERPFFEDWFETQIFSNYLDMTLLTLDVFACKSAHRKTKSDVGIQKEGKEGEEGGGAKTPTLERR